MAPESRASHQRREQKGHPRGPPAPARAAPRYGRARVACHACTEAATPHGARWRSLIVTKVPLIRINGTIYTRTATGSAAHLLRRVSVLVGQHLRGDEARHQRLDFLISKGRVPRTNLLL